MEVEVIGGSIAIGIMPTALRSDNCPLRVELRGLGPRSAVTRLDVESCLRLEWHAQVSTAQRKGPASRIE
jgi:hypothetical protein